MIAVTANQNKSQLRQLSQFQQLGQWQLPPTALEMPTGHKRGPWSEDEDKQLMALVNAHGPSNWVIIARHIQCRTAKQCRERYHQNLKKSLNHDPISEEEGRLIEQLVQQMGKKWAEIARRIAGRSDNAVKNWWNGAQNRKKRLHRRAHRTSVESNHHGQAPAPSHPSSHIQYSLPSQYSPPQPKTLLPPIETQHDLSPPIYNGYRPLSPGQVHYGPPSCERRGFGEGPPDPLLSPAGTNSPQSVTADHPPAQPGQSPHLGLGVVLPPIHGWGRVKLRHTEPPCLVHFSPTGFVPAATDFGKANTGEDSRLPPILNHDNYPSQSQLPTAPNSPAVATAATPLSVSSMLETDSAPVPQPQPHTRERFQSPGPYRVEKDLSPWVARSPRLERSRSFVRYNLALPSPNRADESIRNTSPVSDKDTRINVSSLLSS